MSHAPAVTAWVLSACMALALAGTLYRMPIQVDEALEVIVRTADAPSVSAVFVAGLHNSDTMLRPLRDVQTKLLVSAGDALLLIALYGLVMMAIAQSRGGWLADAAAVVVYVVATLTLESGLLLVVIAGAA